MERRKFKGHKKSNFFPDSIFAIATTPPTNPKEDSTTTALLDTESIPVDIISKSDERNDEANNTPKGGEEEPQPLFLNKNYKTVTRIVTKENPQDELPHTSEKPVTRGKIEEEGTVFTCSSYKFPMIYIEEMVNHQIQCSENLLRERHPSFKENESTFSSHVSFPRHEKALARGALSGTITRLNVHDRPV